MGRPDWYRQLDEQCERAEIIHLCRQLGMGWAQISRRVGFGKASVLALYVHRLEGGLIPGEWRDALIAADSGASYIDTLVALKAIATKIDLSAIAHG